VKTAVSVQHSAFSAEQSVNRHEARHLKAPDTVSHLRLKRLGADY
jgi:hypothetical protein